MSLTYLINPNERGILTNAGDRMPLGLLYIAGALENDGQHVKVYDLNHKLESTLMKDLVTDKPDYVGVSCLTSPIASEVKRILKKVKAHSDTKLIVGGYHPTVMPEDFKGLAQIISGEGEYALTTTKGDGTLRGLQPARHLVNSVLYNLNQEGLRTGTIITSRGCPNNCVFCGNTPQRVREHDFFDVQKDLEYLAAHNYKAVYFLDDVFTLNKPRAVAISHECKDMNLKFRLTTRANYMDNTLVKILAKNGLDIASIGVESGNEEILKRVGKNQTKQQIKNAVSMCYDNGVKTKGFYIIGLPGETEKTAQETIRFAEELRTMGMEYCDFYPLVTFPGTDIWANPGRYNIQIIDKDYSNYLQATKGEPKVVCETKELKAERIGELLKEAKRRTGWKG